MIVIYIRLNKLVAIIDTVTGIGSCRFKCSAYIEYKDIWCCTTSWWCSELYPSTGPINTYHCIGAKTWIGRWVLCFVWSRLNSGIRTFTQYVYSSNAAMTYFCYLQTNWYYARPCQHIYLISNTITSAAINNIGIYCICWYKPVNAIQPQSPVTPYY